MTMTRKGCTVCPPSQPLAPDCSANRTWMGSRAQALGDLLGDPDRTPPADMITHSMPTDERLHVQ